MKYVVAVSGGVDSVVLLNMLVKAAGNDLVVAHFDHGIREDSSADAAFVRELARHYHLAFEIAEGHLGVNASEEQARTARYAFLKEVAERHCAIIVTAHHQDDVLETIAINVIRGTGWRGLAVLDNPNIHRPLLSLTKSELYDYALTNHLEWVEDDTNKSDRYLRNQLRKRMHGLTPAARQGLIDIWNVQRGLKMQINTQAVNCSTTSRYFLTMIDEQSALEILWNVLARDRLSLTRPQRRRLLHAIKTAKPGTVFQAGEDVTVSFTTREFIVKHP